MTTMTTTEKTDRDRDRKRRGVAFLKFGLAGAALLGIAAAATSAAWSDQAWFKADAKAFDAGTKVALIGSLDGDAWSDADSSDEGVAISVPSATFANLVPGATRNVTLHVKNDGSKPIVVTDGVVEPTGDLFATGGATATLSALSDNTLDAGGEATAVLTITAGDWGVDATGAPAFSSATGSLTVQFTGTVATS